MLGLSANPGMSTGSFDSKYGVEIDQLPSENAQTHAKTEWWEHMMVRISDVPGLTQVARGVTPTAVMRISDTPLDDLPELRKSVLYVLTVSYVLQVFLIFSLFRSNISRRPPVQVWHMKLVEVMNIFVRFTVAPLTACGVGADSCKRVS